MSYTTPPTFVASDVLEADQLNILTDDIIDLDARLHETVFMGVSVLRTATQSIPDGVSTSISFATDTIDVGGWWSSGTDIVVPAGAIPDGFTTIYVEIHGQSRAASNGTGLRRIKFTLDGSEIESQFIVSAVTGDNTAVQHTVWAEVSAGQIINMQVNQTSGGALNFSVSSCKVKRLGPGA